jgi:predicted PurR-regulated permease PerM
MNSSTKFLSSLVIAVIFGISFFIPYFAAANHTTPHTIQQLQEQIEQLQARIKVLQQQSINKSPIPIKGQPVLWPVPTRIIESLECPVFLQTLRRGVSDQGTDGGVTKL